MKLLFIEMCNYSDFPLGGQLTFAKQMLSSFGKDLSIAGITTSQKDLIGQWTHKEINGTTTLVYHYGYIKPTNKKPLIPQRITNIKFLISHIHCILSIDFDYIIVQATEIPLILKKDILKKTIVRMPGVSNPLSISRYPWSRPFAKILDVFFFNKIKHSPLILGTADNNSIKAFIERSKGLVLPERVVQFPTRFNESIFYQKNKLECRKLLSIDSSSIVICTVGRLNWFKGWKLMIDSMIIFRQSHQNSHLYFIGDGEDKEIINSYINKRKESDNIHLIGKQDPTMINLYLNACDLFVMGSYKEGWSTTLLEALSCGTPAVTTNFSSSKDLIKDGVNGYVINDRNETQFSEAMIKALLLDKSEILKISKQYEQYSVGLLNKNLLSIIENNLIS